MKTGNYKPSLFSSMQVNSLSTKHRIVMAALTRARSGPLGIPNQANERYYAQRAQAAFIITEATAISQQGHGWPNSPGIYTDGQIAGWKKVTDAVHKENGKIFIQLWHMGRQVHPDLLNDGVYPVAPSAIAEPGDAHTYTGKKPHVIPEELTKSGIKAIISDYKQAAKNALAAGFDGIELHAAAGYLPAQFLHSESNTRKDEYGGTIKNRVRFTLEVLAALCEVWNPNQVGIKISPQIGLSESDPVALFEYLVSQLNDFDLAYLQVMEKHFGDWAQPDLDHAHLRQQYKGVYMANGGYSRESAIIAINSRHADLVAFGRLFIANPDLPSRLLNNHPLASSDTASWFIGDQKGYTSYPTYIEGS